jgi:Fe-S-cluster-containing dehydrogenase component
MGKVFTFDYSVCNGCRNCQISCKDEHCNQPWLPYAEAQPITGQFWMNVTEEVRGQVPVVKIAYEARFCNHCTDAPCKAAVPDAVYTREDGLVIIDPEKAKGKRELVDSCPIGAIYYNEDLDIAQKCTGCAHLLDNGWEEPRCIDSCPTGALKYVDEADVDTAALETFEELGGCGPRLYLINKPKRFIAGCLIDLEADEVVIGAHVDLVDINNQKISSLETDEFGDFKFDQIEKGIYQVIIEEKNIKVDVSEKDICLGDVFVA